MDKDLREMQEKLKQMLAWFHEFCLQNQLKYYVVGGTMLGAVRHKGFIPWDDDIDVGMPREDYEKFLQLTEGKLQETFLVESFNSGSFDFIYPYAKLYDVSTTYVEVARTPIKRGIYIDVFPIDGLGGDDVAKKHFKKIQRVYNVLSLLVCEISSHRAAYKNLAIRLARIIPNHKKLVKVLQKKIDTLSKQMDYESSQYVGVVVGNWGMREIMPRAVFGQPKEYQFDEIVVYGVECYDEYLRNLYGDYMTLPPVEKQVSHHANVYCDLNKGYIEKEFV